jgi:hypothetical protein
MGYHIAKIPKGVYGQWSKVKEEVEEFEDALAQRNVIMAQVELSDLLGAIEAYAENAFNLKLSDLIIMKEATKNAFKDGSRQ